MNETDKLSADIIDTDYYKLLGIMGEYLSGQKTMSEIKGISTETMEVAYALAYEFYSRKKYDKAEELFGFLTHLNHLDQRSWLGLGGCRQMLSKYDKALEAYAFATLLKRDDPRAPFHAAECFFQKGEFDGAQESLENAIEFAGGKNEHKAIQAKAEQLMKAIDKARQGSNRSSNTKTEK